MRSSSRFGIGLSLFVAVAATAACSSSAPPSELAGDDTVPGVATPARQAPKGEGADAGSSDPESATGSDSGTSTGTGTDAGADSGGPKSCPASATSPVYQGANDNPAFLQVYNNNIENLETPSEHDCPGEWQDLFSYIKKNASPDVFLLQQLSGKGQLDTVVSHMNAELGGNFAGLVSESNPDPQGSPCGMPKQLQTNGIVYRTARLEPVGDAHVWQSWAKKDGQCVRNNQARTKNLMQRFRDKVANKFVTVASIHWSTFQGDGADRACAAKNAEEAASKLTMPAYASDLLIWGGDTNEPDRVDKDTYRDWYHDANGELGGSLGFRDAIFSECKGGSGMASCLQDNWTIGESNRIDFIFAKRGDGCMPATSRPHTISFAEGDQAAGSGPQNYSDHRALRVAVHY